MAICTNGVPVDQPTPKALMNLNEIEQKVAQLDLGKGFDLIYELLAAYGLPRASITRLRNGSYDQLDSKTEHLWKKKLYYRFVEQGEGDLHALIDSAQNDEEVNRHQPRFLIVRNRMQLLAVDTLAETTLDIPIDELATHASFFLPWAGIEKATLEDTNYADVKAAEKMARLYDEIIKHNAIETERDVRNLNVFFSRLLFCFFAEDTKVFSKGCFTNAVASLTKTDGSDTADFLEELFVVLNTDVTDRRELPTHFSEFEYVNGSLFADPLPAPAFSAKARSVMLGCGTLDWSTINPDIFGSMIQAVVHPGKREDLGMHYTSVENIMRVIRPLFIDELEEALATADTVHKLQRLLERIWAIKVFDPACGSGNFLVIAYKELRKIEHEILQRIADLDPSARGLFKLSGIKLEHFYGIEIDDFAHEMATLSLWLAKHQMNIEFEELFGVEISLIPLRDTGKIVCGNAALVNWESVCPREDLEQVFLLGNPQYQGARKQNRAHKADFEHYFGTSKYPRDLDYISLWFLKAADYIGDGQATLGFVSTNSICQGAHVALLWPRLLASGLEIAFARKAFTWSNQAKGNAVVKCIIVGLQVRSSKQKRLFDGNEVRQAPNINPYLVVSNNDTIVSRQRDPISERPTMSFGSRAIDQGNLILTRSERDALLVVDSDLESLIKPFIGAKEFIKGTERFCLWMDDSNAEYASTVTDIAERIAKVAHFRSNSSDAGTRKAASRAHSFGISSYRDSAAVVVPRVSSGHRDYVPMGFLPSGTVASDQLYAAYGAEPWLFTLLQSRMHMAWLACIGGRMGTDYRYSNSLVYNTFAFPEMGSKEKERLSDRAFAVIEARERFPDKTLADLYDPDKMPNALRQAHQTLDEYVDSLYRKRPFNSDAERVELLLTLYEAATTAKAEELTHA